MFSLTFGTTYWMFSFYHISFASQHYFNYLSENVTHIMKTLSV